MERRSLDNDIDDRLSDDFSSAEYLSGLDVLELPLDHLQKQLSESITDLRTIDGFPFASNSDILHLSDPPAYAACPNPFLADFIDRYGHPYVEEDDQYRREPFAADVSEGRSDAIGNAHSYHTKVPYKAIMRYILHYTDPGDIILDGFCGTGMTGVAAQLCSDRNLIETLGYRTNDEGGIIDPDGSVVSRVGPRYPIMIDLSPIATFISHHLNSSETNFTHLNTSEALLRSVESRFDWMYLTIHNASSEQLSAALTLLQDGRHLQLVDAGIPLGKINFTIWSDVLACRECQGEIVFWNAAVDIDAGEMRESLECPHCGTQSSKSQLDRVWRTQLDRNVGEPVRLQKQVPVAIHYTYNGRRYQKVADDFDRAVVDFVESLDIKYWYPTNIIPEGDKTGDPFSVGIRRVHNFYTHRNLSVIAALRAGGLRTWFPFSALTPRATKMHRIAVSRVGGPKRSEGGATVGIINGTLYVPSIAVEMNVLEQAQDRIKTIRRMRSTRFPTLVSTQSSTSLSLPDDCCDYIFVDPPFGSNLMYSELNIIWESWLRVFTNAVPEAIENHSQRKALPDYQQLMTSCFSEFYRVLKPGRWMTVEFHNSRNSVWNSIQAALQQAGFVVADVRTLDKQQGSFNQVTSQRAVRQDLVISAYKPRLGFSERFNRDAGTPATIWEFVRQHLTQLPVFISNRGSAEVIAERQAFLLYDRMVAYHLVRDAPLTASAAEFYAGLSQRFLVRDGMYFLPNQAAEYDHKRMMVDSVQQLSYFVSDEHSARQWLRQLLSVRSLTYQEIHPEFLKQLNQSRFERLPELSHILEQNFLKDESDRWYVPDPQKQADLERLRERELLAVFTGYSSSKGKLREFRGEAVRAGFKHCWQNREYRTIVEVADRLPVSVLQEDPQLLMYYDIASARIDSRR